MTTALDNVMRRLEGRAGEKGLGVFVTKNGDVKTTSVDTLIFAKMIHEQPDRLLAVYDANATREMVSEDLGWAIDNMIEHDDV